MPSVLELLARLPRGSTVLDVGSGAGISTRCLLDAGFTVVAIEPSPALRALARARNPKASFDDRSVHEIDLPKASAIDSTRP